MTNSLSLKAEIKEIDLWNHELASMDASTRIEWAVEKFGKGVVASTSFGLQSAVMIHLLKQASSEIPIIFVDTGYLFPATYEYAGNLQEHLTFQVETYSANMTPAFQEAAFGKRWEQGKEGMSKDNYSNKSEPMDRALQEHDSTLWLAGLRKSQAESRSHLSFIENQNGIYKLYPILDWSDRETYQYIPNHNLPYHPLDGMGYDSVGDWHSTRKLSEVESPEDARHGGHGRECGLHTDPPENLDFTI